MKDQRRLTSKGNLITLWSCSVILCAATYLYESRMPPPNPIAGWGTVCLILIASSIVLAILGGKRAILFGGVVFGGLSLPHLFIHSTTPDLLLFYIFVASTTVLIIALAHRSKLAMLGLTFCFLLLFILPESILTGYTAVTNTYIGLEQTNVIIETNEQEAMGYLWLHARETLPLLLYTAVLCGMLIAAGLKVRVAPRQYRSYALMLVAVLAFCGAAVGTTAGQTRLHNLFLIQIAEANNAATLKAAQERKLNLKQVGAHLVDPAKAIYIVVVGESANRHHLHLYGYFRDTSPYLDSLHDGSLIAFRNAISSYCLTSYSLRRALTLATVDSNLEYRDPGMYSIVEILRSAGIRTYWVSNQPEEGQVPAIISNSDEIVPADAHKQPFDGRTLGIVDRILEQTEHINRPTVIFVHLVGSHYKYDARYPWDLTNKISDENNSGTFGPKVPTADVNHYDNSILYTDSILKGLIEKLKRKDIPTSLLYFSDHGESPYVGAGHDPGLFSIGHVEVPLIIWFSRQYTKKYPDILRAARNNIDGAFMLDRLSQVIMTWTHVHATFYQPQHSLLSELFSPSSRWTLDGRINYDDLEGNYCTVTKKQTGFSPGHC